MINVVHTLAETDNVRKGVNYNDGIPELDTIHEYAGVDTGNAGVHNDENDQNENDENDQQKMVKTKKQL